MRVIDLYEHGLALKLHFTSDYDYHRYHGRVANVSKAAFKKVEMWFEKINRQREPLDWILSQLVANPRSWARDWAHGQENYDGWRRRTEAMHYAFCQEVDAIREDFEHFDDIMVCEDGQHPPLFQRYLGGLVSPETIAIIADVTQCKKHWRHVMGMDPIWKEHETRVTKYAQFLTFDPQPYKEKIVGTFNFKRPDTGDEPDVAEPVASPSS